MASMAQIRGMLLEEVLLFLLRQSGYRTVLSAGNDGTLQNGKSGLEVRGRGEVHQIDAIADFDIQQPFSHPQRLLGEAKFLTDKVGLEIVRNAVGVLKDVGEWWCPRSVQPAASSRRYHYQYAIFTNLGFSKPAETYAFAQDGNLIPLARSTFIRPLLEKFREVSYQQLGGTSDKSVPLELSVARRMIRVKLGEMREDNFANGDEENDENVIREFRNAIRPIVDECRRIGGALMAVIRGGFPLFLVPSRPDVISNLRTMEDVTIYYRGTNWFMYRAEQATTIHGDALFSFDLPDGLFRLFYGSGVAEEAQRALISNGITWATYRHS
ncbi:hypothetical protein KJZ99_08090 [bacterium]|nr:hypothetical protein [bacterium]